MYLPFLRKYLSNVGVSANILKIPLTFLTGNQLSNTFSGISVTEENHCVKLIGNSTLHSEGLDCFDNNRSILMGGNKTAIHYKQGLDTLTAGLVAQNFYWTTNSFTRPESK